MTPPSGGVVFLAMALKPQRQGELRQQHGQFADFIDQFQKSRNIIRKSG
jgi:hypothetical protein